MEEVKKNNYSLDHSDSVLAFSTKIFIIIIPLSRRIRKPIIKRGRQLNGSEFKIYQCDHWSHDVIIKKHYYYLMMMIIINYLFCCYECIVVCEVVIIWTKKKTSLSFFDNFFVLGRKDPSPLLPATSWKCNEWFLKDVEKVNPVS